ncbi:MULTISPECIES: transporter substrate-binding domain-containing protein [Micromonospora]|uniref:ABC transporter substrate-binding protein n=1 Tax=Micromonospora solifontis TaxID=2487138 RepID=A0ABX9WMW5_9ACTN|nr:MULTISPECIES: transporter substrate-binding domain-containing protein [Micromonospora]NES14826.1 transporter substrate-binding domain-containing protein [Micromonospora sp. PPF5-17B]NES35390.1 transporter substrate-binding domain-containing protein [Micromonospora solifontis]NES56128.1 transporter substrate-binding domain-containing protein [Micromonospora sp. PPF5-6]RNM00881.1 ABC transporter substrate-binding protein [Micromonospora solifontis]
MRIRQFALLGAATALLAATAACGGSTAPAAGGDEIKPVSVTIDGVGAVTTDTDLAKKVPADVRGRGTLTVATNAPYQPFIDFKVEGKNDEFKGLDHDLFQAASARLGLKATFSQQPFDGLVPGLQAGKYDAIAGGITDKKERQQVATFVDYSASGTGFLVRTGNPLGVRTVADLCGRKVAVQKASNQAKNLATYAKDSCAGKPIEVKEYPENPQAVQALIAGNVDVVAATKVNLVDTAASLTGKAELVDDPSAPNGWLASPNGFGFLKANKELAEAYRSAVQSLIDDGTYAKILGQWKQTPIAVKQATIDQAVD